MFQIAIYEQANTLMLFQRIVSMEAFRIMLLPKITRISWKYKEKLPT